MEKMNDLKALLQHEVQDLISVEDQIIKAMPAMIEKAQNEVLKNTLQEHLTITEKQRTRLDEVQALLESVENKSFLSGLLDKIGGSQKCKGMEGIITEGEKILAADMNAEVKDAAIIACAQKIEHYEICGYGTVRAYAKQLVLDKAVKLFEETLNEEYEADDRLTKLAVEDINERAEQTEAPGEKEEKSFPSEKAGKGGIKQEAAPKKVAAKKSAPPKKAGVKSENKPPKKAATKKTSGKK